MFGQPRFSPVFRKVALKRPLFSRPSSFTGQLRIFAAASGLSAPPPPATALASAFELPFTFTNYYIWDSVVE